ncbi:MAG: lytic murein transglycosylase B, partial [Proteobacteria bacterium]|nr:lytic murein transglycosylase B [Pseudomonadota bacterium]
MKKILLILLVLNIANAKDSVKGSAKGSVPDMEKFILKVTQNNQLDENVVRGILQQAERKQKIIDAMNRPAEKKKQWHEYRNIFLKEKRIKQGVVFWKEHQEVLQTVSQSSGVPIEIIVAIIGVETNYGGNKGSYRVLDALYTLAFHYPRRSPFFTRELEKFIVLTHKENISALETKGSYAGAMGFGQFMPSSYLMYAVDFDKDGQRDLLNNIPDAIASVANYFKAHGWKQGQSVVHQAHTKQGFKPLKKQALKPS